MINKGIEVDNIMDSILHRMVNLSKNTVEYDAFDKMTFDKMFQKCEMMQKIYNEALVMPKEEYQYPFVKELEEDIFYSFLKYSPKFLEDEQIQPEFRVHKEMIQKAQRNENWHKMRNMTKLDEINSAVATAYFTDELLKEMTKRDKKFRQQIIQINEKRKQLINLMNKFANAKGGKEKKQLAQQIENLMKEIEQDTQKAMGNISQITVSQAIKKATKKVAEFHETTNALMWGNETSQLQRVNPEERIILANYLLKNEKLFKLVRELGKLKNIFIETKRREIKHGTSEIYSIDIGKDLGKMLPCEIMKMRHPALKKDFYKRFMEGSLLEYSLRSKEKLGKGNIVVCLDCSGSMNLILYGNITREIYAKALALAILEMAVRENRKYHLILFEASVRKEYSFDRNKKPSVKDMIDIASTYFGGGTNFEAPLQVALDNVNENADIVFITDGECRVGEEFLTKFNAVKKKLNFKVVALQVGDATTEYLAEFSDDVINFTKFIETSKSVFSSLMKGGDGT